MAFKRAERKKTKLRLAICGPSGSGKTYSALLIAQGLAPEGKIALLDTEHGSGELYSQILSYDVAALNPPFTPERYIALIGEAEHAGYDALIIDSLSHAWAGEGGILDMHDKATAASRSANSFMAWREVTPQHNALVETMLSADLHLIATMRTKTAYDLVDDGNGKKKTHQGGASPRAARRHGVRIHGGARSQRRRPRGHGREGPHRPVRRQALHSGPGNRRCLEAVAGNRQRPRRGEPRAACKPQGPHGRDRQRGAAQRVVAGTVPGDRPALVARSASWALESFVGEDL
ncbi:MAG: AAA family ATPase [Gammaproteobacteria bacterium]